MADTVLIFTHYGYSDYLDFTLSCARKTNPAARLILLGDATNADVASRHGWEHYAYSDFTSELQHRFGRVFHHVQGVKHNPIKNGKDWLRYVFERWFFIESFVTHSGIGRFWHFDSDTMVLQNLESYDIALKEFEFSVQCNNTCLNGIMSTPVVSEYCDHICRLFEDSEFLAAQRREFDLINPNYAFSEMRAFDDFKKKSSLPWLYLMLYEGNLVFDDCICQEHGFEMCELPTGEKVKKVYSRHGKVFGLRDHQEVEFVTLNLSWVPLYVFRWALKSLDDQCPPIDCATPSIPESMRGAARKIKRKLKDVFIQA